MPELRPPRGTHDLFGEELRRQRKVAETGRELARRYGYQEIATPIWWNCRRRPFWGRS